MIVALKDSCTSGEQWYFFSDINSLDELSVSLNPRGLRESSLRSALNEFRSVLEEAIEYCPVADLITTANEERRPIPREEEVNEKGDESEMNGEEDDEDVNMNEDKEVKEEIKEDSKDTIKEENKAVSH